MRYASKLIAEDMVAAMAEAEQRVQNLEMLHQEEMNNAYAEYQNRLIAVTVLFIVVLGVLVFKAYTPAIKELVLGMVGHGG